MNYIWRVNIVLPIPIMCSNSFTAEYAPIVFQLLPFCIIFTGISVVSLFVYRMEAVILHRIEITKMRKSVYYSRNSLYVTVIFLALFSILMYPALKYQKDYKMKMEMRFGTFQPYMCSPPRSLNQMRLDWLVTTVHNALRRCSAWLAMSMTIVRYLVITDIPANNSKFSSPEFGLKITLYAFSISFIFSILFYLHVDIVEIGTWHPNESCGMSDGLLTVYSEQFNDFFESNNALIARGRLLLEGIFAKLIPCLAVPVLTGLLIYEIRKSRISSTLEISVANKKSRKSRQDRTTILIIFVAGSFLISEFPLGIVDMYKVIWIGDMNYETLSQNIVYICDAIFTINASIHCLIFFAMSIQYRKSVWNLIGRLNCYKNKKQSQVVIVMSSC
ncbi:hypothetical protein L5515_007173 [Caenorhabditis briggsae]|uniref:G-protein coupled receptors family 1 profile domain-containing protein n=1 Tax=Caenorhabditis briggsae TaxID=6238 RepID=A0AAE9EXS8_CAEBR|nr:hypothetical protein L5515_007173 [Caenorhabditis briggsae]